MQKIHVTRILSVVGIILLIPLFGNHFVDGWNWDFMDFIFAAVMFFITGVAFELVFKKSKNTTYRVVMSIAIILVFLVIWAELAVGLVERVLLRF